MFEMGASHREEPQERKKPVERSKRPEIKLYQPPGAKNKERQSEKRIQEMKEIKEMKEKKSHRKEKQEEKEACEDKISNVSTAALSEKVNEKPQERCPPTPDPPLVDCHFYFEKERIEIVVKLDEIEEFEKVVEDICYNHDLQQRMICCVKISLLKRLLGVNHSNVNQEIIEKIRKMLDKCIDDYRSIKDKEEMLQKELLHRSFSESESNEENDYLYKNVN